MTTPLVTLNEVRGYMAIRADVSMPDVDARLTTLTMLATRQLETALSMEFDYKQRTQYFTPSKAAQYKYDMTGQSMFESGVRAAPRSQSMWLKAPPIDLNAAVSVWYDPALAYDDTTLLDPASGAYVLDEERGKLTLRIMSYHHERAIKVSYFGGYTIDQATGTLTTSAPVELKTACIIQTVFLFTRIQPDNIGMNVDRGQGKVSDGTFSTRGGITPEASSLLWSYRRPALGKY
jgi:hypothetical protein